VKDEGPLQKKKAGRLVEPFGGGKAPASEGGRYKGKRGCGLGRLKVAATRLVSRVAVILSEIQGNHSIAAT
jgi:hypothetical protein